MPRKPRRRPHGNGSVYQRGAGGWRIRWREGRRRRYAHGYPDRETAEKVLHKILADLAAGRVGIAPDPTDVPTLGELAKDWLERREKTHRSADDDAGRWRLHLKPQIGHLRPDEVDQAILRNVIESKLAAGLSSSTARLIMRLASTFYTDLVERGLAKQNPVRMLSRATRRLIRPAHDPRTTPFLSRVGDIRRVFLALHEPLNIAFAIGALGGLRTGEVLALRWAHVDLARRRIHVRESTGGPLKDDESRLAPILDSLHPILEQWHLRTGGAGLVVPTLRAGSKHLGEHTLGRNLTDVLDKLKLPALTWYQATRHTMASQWVMAGGSVEELREILGHSSVLVTERYAHLSSEHFGPKHLARIAVDLSAPTGKIVPLTGRKASRAGADRVQGAEEEIAKVG